MSTLLPRPLRRRLVIGFAAIGLTLPLAGAHAAITVYTDRAAFLAALSAGSTVTTEAFNSATDFLVGNNFYNGVNFRVTGTTAGGNGVSGGFLQGDEFTNTSVDYLFGTPIYALGADFTLARTSSGFNWVINGISTPVFSAAPGTGFFGIISSEPFTLVDVNAGAAPNETYDLDNFTYARTVPEPGTVALAGLGALGLLGAARRRARAA